MTSVDLRLGDSLAVLPTLAAGSVDAIVTDPPYGLNFMGRTDWDLAVPGVDIWAECLRVLKPGGHLLAFGGTRTVHRLACAIEDAGFEIRDSIAWMHGQGFPKGKGQLKPAHEPIVLARKPAPAPWLNVDACRVQMSDADRAFIHKTARPNSAGQRHEGDVMNRPSAPTVNVHAAGRWPANVVLAHAEQCTADACMDGCPVAELDRQSGTLKTGGDETGSPSAPTDAVYGEYRRKPYAKIRDAGGASRYFPVFRYQAKAPTSERPKIDGKGWPTVKPLALMRWLVRLVTPPGGLILDPFAGTGATLQAAELEGFRALGIERDPFAYQLACQRLGSPESPLTLDLPA